ncbi:hypothetical protein MMC13_007107 [Lambiella insularis]|nr:hypothetical protein [Lambiella insularis]
MSFCAFPAYRGASRRRPALSVDLPPPMLDDDYGASTNASVIYTSGANTPLHTTDIIAAEYMTTSPMWMDAEHLLDDSFEASSQSSFNYSSYSFHDKDRDGYQTPLSSLASSPNSPPLPPGKVQAPDELPGGPKRVGTERKARQKPPMIDPSEWQPQNLVGHHKGSNSLHEISKRPKEWQPQDPIRRQAVGSNSLHLANHAPQEYAQAKSLPPLPPIVKSKSVGGGVRSRTSVARKIAAMAGKPSKKSSTASNGKDPFEVKSQTTPMGLTRNTEEPVSKPSSSQSAIPMYGSSMPVFTSERVRKPDILSLEQSSAGPRTSSQFSSYSMPRQTLKDMDLYDNFEIASTAAEISKMKSNRYPSHGMSSTGVHSHVATSSNSIPETNVTKFISTTARHAHSRSVDRTPVAVVSRASSKILVDDEGPFTRRLFPQDGYVHRLTPPPPLTHIHFRCFQSHQNMNPSKNDLAPVPCMTCHADDSELRWKCSWCCLRICVKCMEILEGTTGRNLDTLIVKKVKHGIGNPTGFSLDRRAQARRYNG